jgi:hypothetical protein
MTVRERVWCFYPPGIRKAFKTLGFILDRRDNICYFKRLGDCPRMICFPSHESAIPFSRSDIWDRFKDQGVFDRFLDAYIEAYEGNPPTAPL